VEGFISRVFKRNWYFHEWRNTVWNSEHINFYSTDTSLSI